MYPLQFPRTVLLLRQSQVGSITLTSMLFRADLFTCFGFSSELGGQRIKTTLPCVCFKCMFSKQLKISSLKIDDLHSAQTPTAHIERKIRISLDGTIL